MLKFSYIYGNTYKWKLFMTNKKLTPPRINAPLFLTRLVRGPQNLLSGVIR